MTSLSRSPFSPRTYITLSSRQNGSCCFRVVVGISVLFHVMMQTGVQVCAASESAPVSCNITEAVTCEPGSFLNRTNNCCQQCTPCPSNMVIDSACSSTHDTTCKPNCPNPATFYSPNDNICVIDCSICEPDHCNHRNHRCICDPDKCYLDEFCITPMPCPTTEVETFPSPPSGGNPTSLPSWGIGVIAVGVVLGIVAFSGGFLFMGVCTRKRRTEIDAESSEHSNSGLISVESEGTHSSYIVGYPNRSLFDVLRHTNSPTVSSCGSLSSVQFHQKTMLSSPLPQKQHLSDNQHHTNSPAHLQLALNSHTKPLPARTLQVNLKSKSTVV